MARQHGRCACCGTRIDSGAARAAHVDHCHATGRVRGLLCAHCNSALGFARENAATLYQMAAYLELDRRRPVVYLVGSLRNPKVVALGNEIRALGIECVDNWTAASPTADDAWQAYSTARGRDYRQALESREARHVFHFDRAYLNLADAVVLQYPAGKSGHLEFGYAVGQGKRGYLLMEEPAERYDVMLQFASAPLFHTQPELLDALRADLLTEWRPIP
jgi:nucleoside 2-deoxyribosyltransferase